MAHALVERLYKGPEGFQMGSDLPLPRYSWAYTRHAEASKRTNFCEGDFGVVGSSLAKHGVHDQVHGLALLDGVHHFIQTPDPGRRLGL